MQEKPKINNDIEDQEEEALFEHYNIKVDPGQSPLEDRQIFGEQGRQCIQEQDSDGCRCRKHIGKWQQL